MIALLSRLQSSLAVRLRRAHTQTEALGLIQEPLLEPLAEADAGTRSGIVFGAGFCLRL